MTNQLVRLPDKRTPYKDFVERAVEFVKEADQKYTGPSGLSIRTECKLGPTFLYNSISQNGI